MKTAPITLTIDGKEQEVNVELALNLKKTIAIARDFPEANQVATLQVSDDGINLDMIRLAKVVYLAYRQANMNEYISFSEFQDAYEFDMEEASRIYFSMISKDFRNDYLEEIARKAPKVSSKG